MRGEIMIRSLRAALWLGLFAVALAAPARAQVSLAGVTGVVTDAANAVIPGASVVISNIETGIETQAETNEAGYYTLVSLVPGSYELAVQSDGFSRFVRTNLELETGQQLRLDVALEIDRGAVKGDVIVHEEIQDLPLQGRDFTNLAFLVPWVMPRATGSKVRAPAATPATTTGHGEVNCSADWMSGDSAAIPSIRSRETRPVQRTMVRVTARNSFKRPSATSSAARRATSV